MPIYEYRCLDCDHEFEQIQKFSDPPIDTCPTCSGSVKKLISQSTFHLKGDGWYVTDYARKGSENGKSSSESSETKDSTTAKDSTAAKDSTTAKDSTAAKDSTSSANKGSSATSAADTSAS